MKPKIHQILERIIQEGLEYGYNRAHKHVDKPSKDQMINAMEQAIWNNIHEYFSFDEDFVD